MTKQNVEYWEKLRDPRWQRKRTEVMQRAEYACEDCGANNKTLNVHHSYYEKNLDPWDYPDESLHCLCEPCHKKAQDLYDQIKRLLGKVGLGSTAELIGYALGLQAKEDPDIEIDLPTYEMALGAANCWELRDVDVINLGTPTTGARLAELRDAYRKAKKTATA